MRRVLATVALWMACSATPPTAQSGAAAPSSGAATSSSTAAPALASARPPAPDLPRDAELAALATAAAVEACEWSSDGSRMDACPARTRWELYAPPRGLDEAVLVELLRDPLPGRRPLALAKLWLEGKRYRTTPELASKVLAALRDAHEDVITAGVVVGRIDLARTGLDDTMAAFVHEADEILAAHVIGELLPNNRSSTRALALTREALGHRNGVQRALALVALVQAGERAEACSAVRTGMRDADAAVRDPAFRSFARGHACSPPFEGVVEAVAARPSETFDPHYGASLRRICDAAETSAGDRARAAELARRMTERRALPAFRASALEAAVRCAGAAGKAYAAKFTDDPEIGEAARELAEP